MKRVSQGAVALAPPVLYEDDDIVVVDKPAGMYVHPSPGHETGALTDALLKTRPGMRTVGSVERPGVVHRLDAETSGVMVFAKTQRAYLALRRDFEAHDRIVKVYLAILNGTPKPAKGTIDEPVGDPPKRAVSHYEVLQRLGNRSLVEFRIDTGRMHQIRIHAARMGHPVVGDRLYGRREPGFQYLHAVQLEFDHPVTRRRLVFAVPPPWS